MAADPITESRIKHMFVEFRQEIAKEIDKAIAPVAADTAKNKKFLFGNGDPGWDEKLRVIYDYVKERQDDEKGKQKERRDTASHIVRTVYGVAITTFVMMIINGVVWFLKILPILEDLTK